MRMKVLWLLGLMLAFLAYPPDPVRAYVADENMMTVLVADLATSPADMGDVNVNSLNYASMALGGVIIAYESAGSLNENTVFVTTATTTTNSGDEDVLSSGQRPGAGRAHFTDNLGYDLRRQDASSAPSGAG